MDKALKTPELLEAILLQLPIRDVLLNAPLVCKHWQTTITDSPRLQQALFFKPLNGKPLRFIDRSHTKGRAEDVDDQYAYTVHKNPFLHNLLRLLNGVAPRATRARRERTLRLDASW
ncbi:hypothetical protein LTR85_002238 [Meristemomyces frigidus]|nr:hypothetical protein LTR85_002238 [Meristemomyces frigidus]